MRTPEHSDAPLARCAIGLDVGGSSLKAGVVSASGSLIFRTETPTRHTRPPEQIERDLLGLFESCIAHTATQTPGTSRDGHAIPIGLAVPGLLSPDKCAIAHAANLPTMSGYPLIANLRRRIGGALCVDADCRLAALADFEFGAGRGVSRLVVAVIGTGIGAAVLIDGRPTDDAQLGQVGVTVPASPENLETSASLESVASAVALDRAVRRAVATDLDFHDIRLAIERGHEAVRDAVASWAAALVRGFAVWTRQHRPEKIVIVGGVCRYGPGLLGAIRTAWRNAHPNHPLDIAFSPLGRDASLVGAALAAMKDQAADAHR